MRRPDSVIPQGVEAAGCWLRLIGSERARIDRAIQRDLALDFADRESRYRRRRRYNEFKARQKPVHFRPERRALDLSVDESGRHDRSADLHNLDQAWIAQGCEIGRHRPETIGRAYEPVRAKHLKQIIVWQRDRFDASERFEHESGLRDGGGHFRIKTSGRRLTDAHLLQNVFLKIDRPQIAAPLVPVVEIAPRHDLEHRSGDVCAPGDRADMGERPESARRIGGDAREGRLQSGDARERTRGCGSSLLRPRRCEGLRPPSRLRPLRRRKSLPASSPDPMGFE
jgi:hypothetical protein